MALARMAMVLATRVIVVIARLGLASLGLAAGEKSAELATRIYGTWKGEFAPLLEWEGDLEARAKAKGVVKAVLARTAVTKAAMVRVAIGSSEQATGPHAPHRLVL